MKDYKVVTATAYPKIDWNELPKNNTAHVRSVAELDAFYQEYGKLVELSPDFTGGHKVGFSTVAAGYDDAFFKSRDLAVFMTVTGSSVSYKTVGADTANGVLAVTISPVSPIMTMDLSVKLAIVEVDKVDAVSVQLSMPTRG